MAYAESAQVSSTGWAVRHGIIGGAITGIVFALAEMVGSVLTGGAFLMPLKAFASVPLGIEPPAIPLGTAIPVGLVFHMALSIVLGVIFALLVANVAALRGSPAVLVVAASVYGIAIWVLNFFVIAPAIGRPWFLEAPMLLQFIYHTFFYGAALGLYLVGALHRARSA